MLTTLATLICAVLPAEQPHYKSNPVYRQLIEQGADAGTAKLPSPNMPDGLAPAAQRSVIEGVIGRSHTFDNFTRRSTVAPQVLNIEPVAGGDDANRTWRVDVFFVAYGSLDSIANKEFIEGLLTSSDDAKGDGKELSAADLAKRDIRLETGAEKHEGYGYGTFELLNKVRLSGTTHSYWTRSDDSIVATSLLDTRFTGDKEFANQWRPLTRGMNGRIEVGAAQPYSGSGNYIKMTRLADIEGALFIEAHAAYVEPHGWFNGAGLLRSKLPIVVQDQVRKFRKELLKAR